MHKLYFYAILLLLGGRNHPAISQSFSAAYLKSQAESLQADSLIPYPSFLLDLPAIHRYLLSFDEEENANLQLKIENKLWKLEVWRSNLLHPDYSLVTSEKKKNKPFSVDQTLFLKGKIAGQEETNVALMINDHFLFGQIGDLMIEPAAPYYTKQLPASSLISYYASETGNLPEVFCGSKEEAKKQIETLVEESEVNAKNQRTDPCYTLEIALAADYLAFQQFGDAYTLQNYYLGILNMVRLAFDDEFFTEFRFAVRGFYVVDCPGCDPWTSSTEASDLLASFRDWGNAGGFGFGYDLASMWSGRILNDSLGGLGYLSVICENRRYHVLRNYTQKIGLLRTLQTHEIGHNFSARHDPDETPFIMAPAIADFDVWSDASVTQMNGYINQLIVQKEWCLGGCIPPEAAFTKPQIVGCAPLEVQFTDDSGGEVTAWQWQFEGGSPVVDTLPNPLVVYQQSGVFGAQLRVSNASGESTHTEDTVAIVKGLPMAGFMPKIDTIQRSVQFQFTGFDALTYSWQFGDGAKSQEPNPTHNYSANNEYQVQLIVTNECGADTSSQTITLAAPLQAAFLPQQSSGCAPLSVQFSDQSIGDITSWQWSFPGGSPTESTQVAPLVRYDQPGEYSVRLQISNTNFESEYLKEAAISVQGPPEVSFTTAINPTQRSVQFQFTGSGALTYAWKFGDGAESQEKNPMHTYATSGDFAVRLTASNDCGAPIYQQTIHIPARPEAVFNAAIVQACAPFSTTFTDHSLGEVTTRKWRFPGGQPNTSTERSPTVYYSQPGRYSVRLEVGNTAGIDTLIQEAYIQALPGPTARFQIAGGLGDTVFTFINDSFDALAYEWHFGDGEQSSELLPQHSYQNDGEYMVQLIAVNECGRDTTLQTIQVLRPPVAAFAIVSQAGCSAKVIQFEDRSPGTVTERTWIFEGGTPATSNLTNPVVTYSQPGYYSVKLTVKNAVGEQLLEKINLVYVPESPTARFLYDYLLGDSIVLFDNLSERATTYLWDFGDGQQSTEAEPAHTYQQDGYYTIKLEAQNECRTSLMVTQITVATLPTANFQSDGPNGCAPFMVQFENTSSQNTQSLIWEFPGGQPNVAYSQNPLITYAQPGLYDVRLKAKNLAGEVIEEKKHWIQVEGPPQTAFQFEQDGPTVQFINLSSNTNVYLWDFGDGQTIQEPAPRHEYQTPGNYEVRLSGINNCGADTTTQTLTVIINDTKTPAWQALANVFPNPNTGQFALQLGTLPPPNTRLRLWNSLGQLMQATYWNNVQSPTQWIQIPNPRPGFYLLELESDGEKAYWRVLVAPQK